MKEEGRAAGGGAAECASQRQEIGRERERGLYVIDDDEMCTVYGDGRGVVA